MFSHSTALSRVADNLLSSLKSRCPICRATQLASSSSTSSSSLPITSTSTSTTPTALQVEEKTFQPRECGNCQSTANLWICLICGNIGCGRYQGGDAYKHFVGSDHSYVY